MLNQDDMDYLKKSEVTYVKIIDHLIDKTDIPIIATTTNIKKEYNERKLEQISGEEIIITSKHFHQVVINGNLFLYQF